jgi:hypothetical protein
MRTPLAGWLLTLFGSWTATSGGYGLWDWAAQSLGFKGTYVMPFDYRVPSNVAGDLFLSMVFAGCAFALSGACLIMKAVFWSGGRAVC